MIDSEKSYLEIINGIDEGIMSCFWICSPIQHTNIERAEWALDSHEETMSDIRSSLKEKVAKLSSEQQVKAEWMLDTFWSGEKKIMNFLAINKGKAEAVENIPRSYLNFLSQLNDFTRKELGLPDYDFEPLNQELGEKFIFSVENSKRQIILIECDFAHDGIKEQVNAIQSHWGNICPDIEELFQELCDFYNIEDQLFGGRNFTGTLNKIGEDEENPKFELGFEHQNGFPVWAFEIENWKVVGGQPIF